MPEQTTLIAPTSRVPPMTIALLGNQASIHTQRWSAALAARGHVVVPVDLSGRGRSPVRRVRDFLAIRRTLQRTLRQPRALVAVHQVSDGILATGLRGLHPLVASVWGHDVTKPSHGLRGRLRAAQLQGFLGAADRCTATSEFLRRTLAERFGVACDVVPFGVDLDLFAPRDGSARHERSADCAVRIAYAKWLRPKYGPDILLKALARIDLGVPWEAVIAGEGLLAGPLREQAMALGIAERVRFAGQLQHTGVAELLRKSEIFVMPSREEEFGVAAAEASACGLPVVSTAVGGVPEVVLDGITGLLVAPEDPDALAAALTLLARDPVLRRRLGTAGRAYVARRYVWDRCVDQMERIYADAVETRSTGAQR